MRIFVTGYGTICACGFNNNEVFESLKNMRSGIALPQYLQTVHNDLPVGEVKCSTAELKKILNLNFDIPEVRTPILGLKAATEAVENAKLVNVNGFKIAFISGSTVGGMDIMEQNYDDFLHNNSKNFLLYPHDIGDTTEFIADKIGIFNFVSGLSTACSSGANAVLFAAELIKSQRVDIAVAGACESLSKYHFNGFNSLKILDNKPCRPFCQTRAGLNLGEGAGYIVLESEKSVEKRKINPLCELKGYGNACDAFHQTATSENGEGPYLAMKYALLNAGINHEDIDYINAHGTGTVNNDLTEGIAIKRMFINRMPAISSTKGFTGHTTSASGGVENSISVMSIMENFIPANINFEKPMPELNLIPVVKPIFSNVNNVMTNSFGFGGNDTSIIFSKIV